VGNPKCLFTLGQEVSKMINMFKHLFVLSVSALLLLTQAPKALALDDIKEKESDVFYKLGGGARLRHYYLQDGTAGGLPTKDSFSDTSHRLQLDLRLDKGEYFKTYVRVINSSVWGRNSNTDNNFIINQGWGNWKVSDFLNFKFGRQTLEIGRGLVYGLNEWENLPTYYDGFGALFDWTVLDLSFYALKAYETSRAERSSATTTNDNTNYVIDLKFKDLSDMISMANVSFVQTSGNPNTLDYATNTVSHQALQRFGFDYVLTGVYFETAGSVSYVTGTKTATTGDLSVKQYMFDFEAKAIMPEWSRFNLWVGVHQDSGDKDSTDSKDDQYEPLNYNLHMNAGRMDFFKFGNLTFLRSGVSMRMLSDWYFGGEYFIFSKTSQYGPNYLARNILQTELQNNTLRFGNDKNLAQEVDLWFGKTFQSGVKFEITANYLRPSAAMKSAYDVVGGAAHPLDKPILNLIAEIGMFF
jgi:hypothetical protein